MDHFRRGTLRTLILMILHTGPKGVYDIKKYIKEISFGFYNPSTGVIYPNIKNLIKEGLIKETHVKGKKKYALTENGKEIVEENIKKWKSMFHSKSEKFEKMDKIRERVQKIMENIASMDDEEFEKKFEKILEIMDETQKKLKDL